MKCVVACRVREWMNRQQRRASSTACSVSVVRAIRHSRVYSTWQDKTARVPRKQVSEEATDRKDEACKARFTTLFRAGRDVEACIEPTAGKKRDVLTPAQ